jgi:hypothetical protein
MRNRLLTILLMLMFLTKTARAGFSPALDSFSESISEKQAATVQAGISLTAYGLLADTSLSAVNSLLARVSARFTLGRDAACELTLDGQPMLALSQAGGQESLPVLAALVLSAETEKCIKAALSAIGGLLSGSEVTDRRSIAIKNAGTASGRKIYAMKAEEWNAALPAIVTILRPLAAGVLSGSPAIAASVDNYLSVLTAEGKGTLRRFVLPDGSDLGLEFTGRVSAAGQDARNVTLYCGYSAGKGIYASIKCTAVQGSDRFTFTLSGKITSTEEKNTLIGSMALAYTAGAQKYGFSGTVSLTNRVSGQNEHITGSVTADISQNNGSDTGKTLYALTCDLAAAPEKLAGTITFERSPEKGVPTKGALNVSMTAGGGGHEAPTDAAALRGILLEWLGTLPRDQALLLMHQLAGESWMNGETIPLTDTVDPWVVETEDLP